jgi:hypothetical protein
MNTDNSSHIMGLMTKGIIGTVSSGAGFALSMTQKVEIGLRITTLIFAVVIPVVTLYWMYRSNKRKECLDNIEIQQKEQLLCKRCQGGMPPPKCPLTKNERPKNCPHDTKR